MMRQLTTAVAAAALLLTAGCRVQVDNAKNGENKNVKIDTPLGGLHVRTDTTAAADVGLPVYPDAQAVPGQGGDKSADVHMGFGKWQLRVKVVNYHTDDPQEKVIKFYQKALGRFGNVIECRGHSPVGTPTVTHEGLTCADEGSKPKFNINDDSSLQLKAGSKTHQHIMGVEKSNGAGTNFALIELDLPGGSADESGTSE